jgi:diguanylate cyclase (GGDEF)-like protein
VTRSHTGTAIPEDSKRAALGFALGARAPDAVKAVFKAIEDHTSIDTDLALTSDSAMVGTLLIARWLVTGEGATESDMAYLAGIGNVSFEHGNSIAAAAIGTMTWRDFLVSVIREEGAKLQCSRQLIAEAIAVVLLSCDADVVQFSRIYDARMSGLNAALEHQALHDSLTGLPNRTLFMDRLAHELKTTKRRKAVHAAPGVCVAAIDVDYLKLYNDTFGHQAGDQLLVAVSEAWKNCLREVDHLARIGGDEFVLLLPDCGIEDAREVVQRIHDVMPGRQTCSVGVAEWNGSEPADALLGRADAALYGTKRSGRGSTTLAEAADAQTARSEPALVSVLEQDDVAMTFLPVSLAPDGVQIGWKGALVSKSHPGASSAQLRIRADREAVLQDWDRTERVRAIEAAPWLPAPHQVFINYDIHSWLDPGVSIEHFRQALEHAKLQPATVVLCLAGYLPGRDTGAVLEVAATYRAHGIGLCVTPEVLEGIPLGLAARLRPEFVEMPTRASRGAESQSLDLMLRMVKALGSCAVSVDLASGLHATAAKPSA